MNSSLDEKIIHELVESSDETGAPDNISSKLTPEYIEKNAWVPADPLTVASNCTNSLYLKTIFGNLPLRNKYNMKKGDIIIFKDFEDWVDPQTGRYKSTKFLELSEKDALLYKTDDSILSEIEVIVSS